MQRGNRIGLAAVLMCAFTPGLFADTITIFTFVGGSGAGETPFTQTVNGLQASYSSDGDPGGFTALFAPVLSPLPVLLMNPGVAGLTLTIDFSAPRTGFATVFGTELQTGVPSVPFNLTAFNGASQVGSATATGIAIPGTPLADGLLLFSGPAFDSVTLSAPAADSFWLDVFAVSAAPTVPEPSSLSLVAFVGFVGFCAIAITRLRRSGA
jgi:hypothetical protein